MTSAVCPDCCVSMPNIEEHEHMIQCVSSVRPIFPVYTTDKLPVLSKLWNLCSTQGITVFSNSTFIYFSVSFWNYNLITTFFFSYFSLQVSLTLSNSWPLFPPLLHAHVYTHIFFNVACSVHIMYLYVVRAVLTPGEGHLSHSQLHSVAYSAMCRTEWGLMVFPLSTLGCPGVPSLLSSRLTSPAGETLWL